MDSEDALLNDVDEVFGGEASVFSGENFDALIHAARDPQQIEAARAAVESLRSSAQRDAKLSHWAHGVEGVRFVSIENRWRVARGPDGWLLTLASLREPHYSPGIAYGNAPESPTFVAMPDGLLLTVRIHERNLTDQAHDRLIDGTIVRAGVFGRTGSLNRETGHMQVSPLAVYARVETGSVDVL